MGVEVVISIHAPAKVADRAAHAAFARVAALDSILSDWRRGSELNRLSDSAGAGWHPVSAELFEVLALARAVASASDGAFDPTIGALTQLWRHERNTGVPADSATLRRARATVDWRSLHLDSTRRMARLDIPGTRLDLGGIAKGWILDQALATLTAQGATVAMVEAGGDLVAGDPPPGQSGWRVAVTTLAGDSLVSVSKRALAVSGPASQSIRRGDGTVHSHVIDPATGQGLTSELEVTVSAPCGAMADAVATALTVLPSARWPALLERFSAELISPRMP